MGKYFYPLMILLLILIGCISSKITPYPTAYYEPTYPEEVEVYYLIPTTPFEVIGEVQVSGAPAASWRRVGERLKNEAAKIGGDAVILVSKQAPLVGVYQSPIYVYRGQYYYSVSPSMSLPMYGKYLFGLVIKWNLDEKTPTSISLKNISGTWVGTIEENYAGKGTFKVTISQHGSAVIGTWSSSFSDPIYDNAGELKGTFVNELFTVTLTPNNSNACPFTIAGTLSGNYLVGTYKSFNCLISIKGTFNLTKID
ncbi:MAG: hypothetical protein ACETWM_13805 [Candidatus Lokiarchaeia archaeon]